MIWLISQNKTVTFQDQHGVTDYDIDGLSPPPLLSLVCSYEKAGSFYYHHRRHQLFLNFPGKQSHCFFDVKNALMMKSLTFEKLATFMMTFSQRFRELLSFNEGSSELFCNQAPPS